jgi:antitoxin component YwqK of YwqJK toxin-antitoxin module
LSNIAIYKNGKLDGPSQLNHENGQLHINTIFKDGVVDGFYEQYDNSGTLRSKCFHVNGKKQECEVDF